MTFSPLNTTAPLLEVRGLTKTYARGLIKRRQTFAITANFSIPKAEIIGVMGPNGSGKTTLFELLSGSNIPGGGTVLCGGQDVHRVKYRQRDRMVIHYHQSYQVRRTKKQVPEMFLENATSNYPLVHIFDEPQFSTQDGYIGFMLGFFRRLRDSGRAVLLCVHPYETFHIDILRQSCERFLFVAKGQVAELPNYQGLLRHPGVRDYLGGLAEYASRPQGQQ